MGLISTASAFSFDRYDYEYDYDYEPPPRMFGGTPTTYQEHPYYAMIINR